MSDDFTLYNHEQENGTDFDTLPDAKEQRQNAISLGKTPEQLEIFPPGQSPGDEKATQDNPPHDHHGNPVSATDGGTETVQPEVVDNNSEPVVETEQEAEETLEAVDELQKSAVDKDPLKVMPGHFVDNIQGTPTINKKGYCVLAERFEISVTSEALVKASDTDFEYAEWKATATTQDGREYSGTGSAHIERDDGDDPYQLNEHAETRAMKRAVQWATGVGIVGYAEMLGEGQ